MPKSNGRYWLMGYGFWNQPTLTTLNTHHLRSSGQHLPLIPVVIMEQTSHSMWVNSKALKIARISQQSPDPQGGAYLKDQDSGKP
ncbi:amidohydrolase family protein [Vibrio lentus]|nr:amidohydrolase family protein [Vibrio lentus]